ncbi:hypothetical protein [Tautonia plasticadhaerens]|uniref:Uncharacterized protein n=1 Tax=Tautonia plasticadhaerens TaxID=2527974 RepID=A0A518HD96_9BACT|nr:hypothetical protein [Tautonia plasticadhaerens]QDV38827.1 hypothetical protein ElP_67840 [Tautonia plasticadhaerens]
MPAPADAPAPRLDWKGRHAFGLPPGSVRALLALLIAATLCGTLALRPDREVPAYLRDLMFIILGHYFAVRGRARGSPDEGEAGAPPPLYLPKGTVRLLLVLGFVAVAALLARRGRLAPIDENPGSVTLLLVGGFLLGALMKWALGRFSTGGRPRWFRILEDVKAVVALASAAVLVVLCWDQASPFLPDAMTGTIPRLGEHGPEHLASALVGFYFGSR